MGAVFSVKPEKNQKSELPILTSTACYPYMSLPQLANTANVIIDAEVIKVNDSIIKKIPVSLTMDTKVSDVITYPVIYRLPFLKIVCPIFCARICLNFIKNILHQSF